MKGFAKSIAIMVVFAVVATSPLYAGFGVRALAGVGYIRYADFNDFADYITDNVVSNFDVSGELGNIHFVPEVGGELVFSMVPMVKFGLGAGVLFGKSSISVSSSDGSLNFEHRIKAYPLTGTIYIQPSFPFIPSKPYAFVGAGLYVCRLNFSSRLSVGTSETGYDAELSRTGFGFHGGAGIEFGIVPAVSFGIEISGRLAKIKGFEGSRTTLDGEKTDVFLAKYTDEHGNLVYGPEPKKFADDYGEGEVDLSGYSGLLYVKIFF